MPGWYVHMEAAHQTAQRLRTGAVPPGLPIDPAEAVAIGEKCHTWRNYLEIGAIGPDLFYMLPDFVGEKGVVIRQVIQWAMDVWSEIDEEFVSKWEKWIDPISTNNSQLASQLTGGLSAQLGQVLDELTAAVMSAFKGLLAQMGDWFGLLTSGVPQGFGNEGFYWADTFHYRRTYQFPYVLFRQARQARQDAATEDERNDADARIAFAVGWMSHCATDVTGHAFTNAKTGGPYRDHWQRHHLVESHIDAENYATLNTGEPYGEYGTSALHFRVALRGGNQAPYTGRSDSPAFDYFDGFPAYDTADGPTAAENRRRFFDLDSEPLPDHLVNALLATMADVHPDGPRILSQEPAFSATDAAGNPDGRPNRAALDQMWTIVYGYLKMSSSDGLSPRMPKPPEVFTDHSFPTPPGGGGSGIDDDPARGADVDDDDSFSLLDLLLALFAWAVYLAQVAIWLATVLPGLILDVATFPAREVLYYGLVVPAWNLFMLSRRAMVMSGFLVPKPEEIDQGLVTLGSAGGGFSLSSALDDPGGNGLVAMLVTEPSGRIDSGAAFGLDPAYPRNIVRDDADSVDDIDIAGLISSIASGAQFHYAGDAVRFKPTEWIAPWRYPLLNQSGAGVPLEGSHVHVGPYVVATHSTILLSNLAGDNGAREKLSGAESPQDTRDILNILLPDDKHLGGPIDYSLYLVAAMSHDASSGAAELSVNDFNLDSDRGYAWHCWDWDRHDITRDARRPDRGEWEDIASDTDFVYAQPCTPPQFFHADTDSPPFVAGDSPVEQRWFDPRHDLLGSYLRRDGSALPHPDDDGTCEKLPWREPVFGLDWKRRMEAGQR